MPPVRKSSPSHRKIQPVYCFLGEDIYRKLEALRLLRKKILSKGEGALNYDYLLASEVDSARILDAARAASWGLFNSGGGDVSRLVVVDEAEDISAAEWKVMEDYFQNPSDSSCLIFLVNRNARKWSRKKIFPSGSVKDFRPYRGKTLINWAKKEADRRGLIISRPVLEELIRLAGEDSGNIIQELSKLELYPGPGKSITPEVLRELAGKGQKGNIFNLTKLILGRKKEESLLLLNRLLDEGEEPLRILGFLIAAFRRLWLGREVWDETNNRQTVCRNCGVRYYQNEFMEQVKNFSPTAVPAFWRLMLEANTALKGGEKSTRITIERMVLKMMRSVSPEGG